MRVRFRLLRIELRELNDSSTREEHSCSALCSAPGTCQIETSPQSVEATFTGRHETYQYTKVISVLVISVTRFSVFVTCRPVHSRFVWLFTLSYAHCDNMSSLNQSQSDFNVSRPFLPGKHRTKARISIIPRTRIRSIFARFGMIPIFPTKQRLNRYSCDNCNYFCTLPLGEKLTHV
jgi:hypothetical protein